MMSADRRHDNPSPLAGEGRGERSKTGSLPVVGCVLAGGLARRMGGGDKALMTIGERTILDHVLERLESQAAPIVINANGDPIRFARFGLPVAADPVEGFAGPLAGVLAGLEWAQRHAPAARWIVTVAGDTPFFPLDLVARLKAAADAENADLACAASHGRAHPVFGLWPVALAGDLRDALVQEEIRKVDAWTGRHRLAIAEFQSCGPDPFFNANRPEDLAEAARLAGAQQT